MLDKKDFLVEALLELVPQAQFHSFNGDVDLLKWLDEREKPTNETILNKMQELQNAEPMLLLREERNRRLQETDWTQYRDVSLSNDSDWQTYRQSLRDLPQNFSPIIDIITEDGYPIVKEQTDWPEKPS